MKLKKRTPTDKKRESITIAQSLCDQNLLGAALGDPTTWSRWLSVLRAAFALPMTEQDKVACALAPSEAPHGGLAVRKGVEDGLRILVHPASRR